MLKHILFSSLLLVLSCKAYGVACAGRFPNPITDVCWSCLFPLKIGPTQLTTGEGDNSDPSPPMICRCPMPPPVFQKIGVGITFWEPTRIAEVVRTPMCSPTLNGAILGTYPAPAGTNQKTEDLGEGTFYHFHWIQYPVLNWLGMVIASGVCQTSETFDVAYMSEFDPFWDSDEETFIFNPEAVLFTNPVAQAACAADSIAATTGGFGLDALFWCAGSQGSVFPISGSHANHVSGVDTSLATVHRAIFKMHRELIGQDTSTPAAICGALPQPVLRKTQYKQQMLYPIPQNLKGYGLGAASLIWGAGREFPYRGEDFSYLVWRKRRCCAY